MPNNNRGLLCLAAVLLISSWSFGEDWYRSNAAGMALEPVFSRLGLREDYVLSVKTVSAGEIPERLRTAVQGPFFAELHTLYEKGDPARQRWVLKTPRGATLAAAAFDDNTAGFIELYNDFGNLTEEYQYGSDQSVLITRYSYRNGVLIQAETSRRHPVPAGPDGGGEPAEPGPDVPESPPAAAVLGPEEKLWTDRYQYTRAASLRSVERIYETGDPPVPPDVIEFPSLAPAGGRERVFVDPVSPVSSDFLGDVLLNPGNRVLYTTDDRGRVLRETREDEDGNTIGEIQNTWSGDRLESVVWTGGSEERRVEYTYDSSGDRILEQDYRNGVLERTVRKQGDQEVEELYINGTVVLRALWEGGRKISEEQIRPGREN
ncbi:hypothetical protein [Breznakiella homolactica]|uniref:Uncharacterized protein n=1 Tax=Breznakiella homolactica TaxID=2798577 RepID=A0A7T8B876_9SPIR|nr:hypothetical protein [Breznakiella homolactica]QQO08284.1 hypothetical protein JFL75_15275 [Breznakiella homolactica]